MEAPKLLWIATEPPRPGEECSTLSITYGIEWLPPETAFEVLRQKDFSAIILSFPAPGWTPCELLEAVQRLAPSIPVLIRDPRASVFDAVRLARLGVYQFLASEGENEETDQADHTPRTDGGNQPALSSGGSERQEVDPGGVRQVKKESPEHCNPPVTNR